MAPLEHESDLPYHAQLKQLLREQIKSAAPHTALPSELEMERGCGVSRTVVRQALLALVHEGLIYRRKGKGSFVAPTKITEGQVQRLVSFTDEMTRRGYHPVTQVLTQRVIPADAAIAERLALPLQADVVHLQRMRLLDDEPLLVSNTWVPADLCPGLERADIRNRSLYEIFQADHGRTITSGSRVLEAVAADRESASVLNTRAGRPLMRLEIISVETEGRRIEYSVAHHRGDRARFQFDVTSSSANQLETL
jgi:GntR family transcriptional regulator